jgi:Mannosyltransferase putative
MFITLLNFAHANQSRRPPGKLRMLGAKIASPAMNYTRATLDAYLRDLPPNPGGFRGRGIVISAGAFFLISGYVAVRSLRAAGCGLPIQLWHLGPAELPDAFRLPFEKYDVEFVDSHEVLKRHPMRVLGGWQNKPFAIAHSPFEEVLSLDADNVALADPAPLFDDPGYRAHGQIFWPDFLFEPANDWSIKPYAWEFLGLPSMEGAELESGQLLMHKTRSWEPLMLAFHMNENSNFYYKQCTYGDKDTYRLAWEYLRRRPYVIPTRPQMLEDFVRIQHAPDGSSLFQHSRKWLLPAAKNGHLPSFRLEAECREWLAQFEAELAAAGVRFA